MKKKTSIQSGAEGWASQYMHLWQLKRPQKDLIFAVLHSHLLINHFIDKFINELNPNLGNMSEISMDFDQKLKLIKQPKNNLVFSKFIRGIKQLNTVRNNIAHELEYDLQKSGVSEMAAALDLLPKNNFKNKDPIEVINSFTPFAMGILGSEVRKEKEA
ncbi:MAG: hypothetical protein IH886_04460 [Nitrospinae bacterium]|nr:hypothetical protein [Nitrospinota bacterium]